VAYTIAHSPLVKTALFASDPNWGRILAAVGRAGLDALEIERVRIWLGPVLIVEAGGRAASYTEAAGAAVMRSLRS
jgi:glutamate N-acetyltransferase / amino-acid N-acetyltransferase